MKTELRSFQTEFQESAKTKDVEHLWMTFKNKVHSLMEVSKGAKIRNRYNQVPHLTQDTNGKVTNSQQTPQTRAKRPHIPSKILRDNRVQKPWVSRHHIDCFTDLVYRYYKDGRRPISPGQIRPGNPDH